MTTSLDAPYCGAAPSPAELLSAWNLDWRLLVALALLAAAVRLAAHRKLFAMGWLALVVAFVSPLCALAVALFSARSVHHLMIVAVATPLLGAAFPRFLGHKIPSSWALLLTLITLTLWHVPAVYTLAWQSHAVYWLLQIVMLVAATAFWSHIFSELRQASEVPGSKPLKSLAQIAAFTGAMGLIGAVLTFAPKVLFLEHVVAPLSYGLHPLEDQQLAGLLMWVPGFIPLAAIAAWVCRSTWLGMSRDSQVAPT